MVELIGADAARYAEQHTSAFAGQLAEVASWTQANTSSPQMMSGLAEARLLEVLVVIGGAREILEIGAFTGVGALTMAAALPPGAHITTLEIDEDRAAVARRHFAESPYGDRIELLIGDAVQTIAGLPGPFDLVYVDADKVQYPAYYEAILPKLSPRGVIVADNLFRAGSTLDPGATDPGTEGMREFARQVHEDERVHNVLLTIGDGVMLAWLVPATSV